MKRFLHQPKFFIDRIQLIFALLLIGVVFVIAYLTTTQLQVPISPSVTPTPSPSQNLQEVIPTGQNIARTPQDTKAVALVENLKDVKDAKSAATTSNTKVVTEIDSYPTTQNNFYIIHAYEIVPDGDGTAHTATVGWYDVDPQTGTVTNVDLSPSPSP